MLCLQLVSTVAVGPSHRAIGYCRIGISERAMTKHQLGDAPLTHTLGQSIVVCVCVFILFICIYFLFWFFFLLVRTSSVL